LHTLSPFKYDFKKVYVEAGLEFTQKKRGKRIFERVESDMLDTGREAAYLNLRMEQTDAVVTVFAGNTILG